MILCRRKNVLLILFMIDIVEGAKQKKLSKKEKQKEARETCDGKEPDFCKNGSKCQRNNEGLKRCYPCPKEYTGFKCETPLSTEEDQERLQQIARNMPDSEFISQCTDEFEDVALDCENGGTCMAAVYQNPTYGVSEDRVAKCFCPLLATGLLCENKINGCKDKPCVHGKCSKIKNMKAVPAGHDLPFLCKCGDKHTGKLCETELESKGQCSINCRKSAKKSKLSKFKKALKKLFRHITEGEKYAGTCTDIDNIKFMFQKHGPQEYLDELVANINSYKEGVFTDEGICVCYPGYHGAFCDKKCTTGRYGQFCLQRCHQCEKKKCDRKTGKCKYGCRLGLKGDKCDQEDNELKCKAGTATCLFGKCVNAELSNGTEVMKCECKEGYQGVYCDSECPTGTYGEGCEETCSEFCREPGCDATTGSCPDHKDGRCIGHFKDEERCLGQNDASVETSFEMVTTEEHIDVQTLGDLHAEVTDSVMSNLEDDFDPRLFAKLDGFDTEYYLKQAQKQLETEWDTYPLPKQLKTMDVWKNYLEVEKSPHRKIRDLYQQRMDQLDSQYPDELDEAGIDAFLADPDRGKRSPQRDPEDTEKKQQPLRQKRQAQPIKYSATVSFPADSAQTINLQDEVLTAATQTAKTFESSALPGLKIDERSIDVSEAVVVLSSDNSDSNAVSGRIFGIIAFLAIMAGAIIAAVVVFRRKKTSQEQKKKQKNPQTVNSKSKQRSTITKKSKSAARKSGSSARKSGSTARK